MTTAVILAGHGTVEQIDDLEPFTTNIRRGRPPPKELIEELVRRYTAIGGRSPLTSTCETLAKKLEARLSLPVRLATRMWHPYPKDVVAKLASEGVQRLVVLSLAQFSSHIYAESVREAARSVDASIRVDAIANWGSDPALVSAFRNRVDETLAQIHERAPGAKPTVLFTAHSLPNAILKDGDSYEIEFRASVGAVAGDLPHAIAFQSQGATSLPGGWLGPDLIEALDLLKAKGESHVVFAPTGFLADHVEILYDLDIEARAWAEARGLEFSRIPSLNADEDFVTVLETLIRREVQR